MIVHCAQYLHFICFLSERERERERETLFSEIRCRHGTQSQISSQLSEKALHFAFNLGSYF
ncbi:MAG: hypothetical protein K7J15_04445, partial [Candidatus Regiella insecticola]|nr:hypothetical protein [Candidatus Regiella insecticola]